MPTAIVVIVTVIVVALELNISMHDNHVSHLHFLLFITQCYIIKFKL